jgi:hypothetical protein
MLQKAEAQLAYELQAAKIRQRIRNEEIQIEVVERRKQIEIEEQEVQRKERELNATVRLPAEAESYRVQMIAEGKRYIFNTSLLVLHQFFVGYNISKFKFLKSQLS